MVLQRIIGIVLLAALLSAVAPLSAQPRTRAAAITEERVALVIGNGAYRISPLPNPVNDARLLGGRLKQAGFKVTVAENLDRRGLFNALREFGDQLSERTIAVFYYAGHALQLRDRNYLLPVDMEMPRSEDEIPISAIDVNFMLGRMSHARSRINIVILDACRDNPFAEATGPKARGLAQTDAPVGTLLAFATGPGKVAEDGEGSNSLYTKYLAQHLLSPGLPVELMFKRVRESVVRESQMRQVPWETSSLQGEFAFVPGVTTQTADAGLEEAGELAFWDSVQTSGRAEEYRAYLRQYPNGRFVSLAQARIAAFTRDPAPASVQPPNAAAMLALAKGGRPELLPSPGDTWRYRVQDQFRIGDLFMTATVNEVTADGVAESWSSTSDAKLRTTVVPVVPGFIELPGWTLTPPEFSPYLLAAGQLAAGQKLGEVQRRLEGGVVVPLRATVEGTEDVAVGAGRFHATKVVLRGQATRGSSRNAVAAEHVIWYAPKVKRVVKYTVSTRVGGMLQESTLFELVEYKLN